MPRICFVLVAGLDRALLQKAGTLPTLASLKHQTHYQPILPAVTCSMQATLTTGVSPDQHGILCNGLYTHGKSKLQPHLDLSNHAESRRNVSFWEQSNTLLEMPRFWQAPGYPKKKVAMLFWQNSMRGAADVVLTPKPVHTPDGKTLTACWSDPPELYPSLVGKLGPFPLHNYWSPMAGLPSSQWIVRAALDVWQQHSPDLQLVYIPHLDFNLQRLGPSHPAAVKDLQDVDALLAPLAEQVRNSGGTLVVAGDYGMYDVDTPILPNLALREASMLTTCADPNGKLLLDYDKTPAFVLADHQIAFLHCSPAILPEALAVLTALPGVEEVLSTRESRLKVGLASERAGEAVLLAVPTAWFAHDWWRTDAEKPAWQFGVDIHNKPGYDPRELFFDPQRKCIAQDPKLVKGSHGRIDDTQRWPMLLSDVPLSADAMHSLTAPAVAQGLAALLRQG